MGTYIQTEEIDENDYLDETDLEVIQFIKNLEKENLAEKPESSSYRIATHTSTCYIGNKDVTNAELFIDITYIIKHLTKKIIEDNFLNPVENPIFQGIVTDHLNIRFDDDMHRKKKYIPNTVCVTNIIHDEKEKDKSVIKEYFNDKDLEGTRVQLEDFLENHKIEFVQKNGRQKKERQKKEELQDYEKQNVITTYNMNDIEQTKKVMNQQIQQIDGLSVKSETTTNEKSSAESKEYEHMYNSCSIIVKPFKHIKAVNIALFSNSQMTISGSKVRNDGLEAAKALLREFQSHPEIIKGIKRLDTTASTESARKKNKIVYPLPGDDYIKKLEILNYNITLVNANFNTNFNIDLKELNQRLIDNEEELFVVYDPEKHRGVQINYFWNKNNKVQDGVCRCSKACSAKKIRKKSYSSFEVKNITNNYSTCTKVKICIFKSGAIGLIGGTQEVHTEDSYQFVNNLLDKYYKDVVKVSLDDYLKEKKSKKNDALYEIMKSCDLQLGLGLNMNMDEEEVKSKNKSKGEKKSKIQKIQSTIIIKELPKKNIQCKIIKKFKYTPLKI